MENRRVMILGVLVLVAAALVVLANRPPPPGARRFERALALVGLALVALVAGACDSNVAGCPEAVAASSCAALVGADLPGRCEQVFAGSAPLLLRRPAPVDPVCSYPPTGGLFVGRFECPSSPVELWCLP